MSDEIIGLHHWFDSSPGRYLLAWEQERYDELVADIFGYHALQLGMPGLQGLRANRMPHRWLALGAEETLLWTDEAAGWHAAGALGGGEPGEPALLADPVALPFSENSLDLVLLPHALELSIDPHAALREVQRVLVPEGRVVISGLNPVSLWGLRQRRARLYQRLGAGGRLYLPDVGEFIGHWRLRDWLRLLNFEVESVSFGCYRPAVRSAPWLERFDWMDGLGARWWPILGAAYVVVAVKRVHGVRLLGAPWRRAPKGAAAPVPVANRGTVRDGGPAFHVDGRE
ncbi:methyltransferase domain-containing protein [Acidovorax sp. SUPP1855]|uniref:class I SAM-dependent methyltransferase n=1 Tax=unclassified Acidovorax TaxID=2684926 RepID=UPI0023DE230B|nr:MULTISPECIES: methyltransferase domain-containing protein [Comamonadaceae]WOI46809.1 methyltransferase domain-containing protein [Paracidovorax avenae]GKS85587.1 methyltransferase domain-containing protein [Acidovorax sp. SUPP1855]GKS98050.1 methyltransferase domain-containing protein [Acidovorax sp. SUPP3434]